MYSQSITRKHRMAFVLLLDRSGSMAEPLPGEERRTKAEAVSEIANLLLFELVERARRSDGVHNYYDVAVVGYSGRGVESLLDEKEWFVPINRVAYLNHTMKSQWVKVPHPQGGELMQRVVRREWIAPGAEGATPLYEALCELHRELEVWCREPHHQASFPPLIFHITDGEASDADPESLREVCRRIRSLGTADGEVLLVNCHLSSRAVTSSVLFPESEEALGESRYGRLLYACSSPMPQIFEEGIRALKGADAEGPFRGMCFNSSPHEVMLLLNIGSVSSTIQ